MDYIKTKNKLDTIRKRYNCAGDIIFKTAIQYIIEYGQYMFKDEEFIIDQKNQINSKHDLAEKNGEILWITRDFEMAIFDCAIEMSEIEPYSFMNYIQKEIYVSNEGGMDYSRAIELLERCVDWMSEYGTCETAILKEALLDDIGFDPEEIHQIGFDYVLPSENEEYDEKNN